MYDIQTSNSSYFSRPQIVGNGVQNPLTYNFLTIDIRKYKFYSIFNYIILPEKLRKVKASDPRRSNENFLLHFIIIINNVVLFFNIIVVIIF